MFMQQERMRYVVITAAERSNRLKIHVNSFHTQEVYTGQRIFRVGKLSFKRIA